MNAFLASAWPIFVLDFEASGLGARTYPIEVGVAFAAGAASELEVWSTLVRPTDMWLKHGNWIEASAEVHGIAESELAAGMDPTEVMTRLNGLIGSSIAFVDGGRDDVLWLDTLVRAAGVSPSFRLADWDALGGQLASPEYRRMVDFLERRRAPHRAGADAARLLEALKFALSAL